jgi:hypothetical protein
VSLKNVSGAPPIPCLSICFKDRVFALKTDSVFTVYFHAIGMNAWLLDSAITAGSVFILIVSLIVLPAFLPDVYAYIIGITLFIVIMSIAGYRINAPQI